MLTCPANSYVEILTLKVMALGAGDCWGKIRSQGWNSHDRVRALIKATMQRDYFPLVWGDSDQTEGYEGQVLPDTNLLVPCFWISQPLEWGAINFHCLTLCVTLLQYLKWIKTCLYCYFQYFQRHFLNQPLATAERLDSPLYSTQMLLYCTNQ